MPVPRPWSSVLVMEADEAAARPLCCYIQPMHLDPSKSSSSLWFAEFLPLLLAEAAHCFQLRLLLRLCVGGVFL